MICEVCGHDRFVARGVERSYHVKGQWVVVEGIPSQVCERCGAANFTAAVAEQVRQMIHQPHKSGRFVQAELLDFHAA